ncbi:YgaP family membrane protein [Pseudooceanicola sp. 200-1SW]|uniref:YgaP family membrane protein n=1 Tax=Pseudooceanicola sp. 200-1SW TaxID=3425949 RepID=UPI003D7FF566
MSVNMGKLDRILRLVIAAVLVYLAFGSAVAAAGLLHWLALIVAVVMVVTALVGNCPLYSLVGLKTCKDC